MKKYIHTIIITIGVVALTLIPLKAQANVNYSYFNLPYSISSNPTNNPPVVNAGPNVSINSAMPPSNTNVSVNGSATDSDGVVASMAWSVFSAPAGASVNISPSSSTPNLTPASLLSNFSNLALAGVYTFCLDATDDDAAQAIADCMNVTVTGGVIVSEEIDLIASTVSPTTATVGVGTSFSSVVTNQGMDPTGASFSNFFQVAASANGGGPIADLTSTSMGALAGNGATDITTSPNYTFFTAGTFSVRACADKSSSGNSGTITETNESNNCGPWTNIVVSPPVLPAPTISFSAVDNPINSGQPARLVWTTQNATSCETQSGPWLNPGTRSATQGVPGESTEVLTAQTNFGIKCTGPNGFATAYTTVYINTLPLPTVSLNAVTPIDSGQSSTLSWSTTNATSCSTQSGPWINPGSRGTASAGESTGPLTVQTTYGLRCTGPNGSASAYATVTIRDENEDPDDPIAPLISYFQPFSCVSGGGGFGSLPKFAWESTNSTSCTITRITSPVANQSVDVSAQASGGSLEFDGLYYFLTNLPVVGSTSDYRLQCFNGPLVATEYAAVNTCSPDFSMSASPIMRSFVNGTNPGTGNPGKIATYVISVNPIGGFTDSVDLSIDSFPTMPPSTSFTFSLNTVNRNGSSYETSVLTIGIDLADFPPGGSGSMYTPIVVQGRGGAFSRTVNIGADSSGKTRPVYIER